MWPEPGNVPGERAGTEPASARQHLISPFLETRLGAEDGAVTKPDSGKLMRQNETNRATLRKRAAESGLIKHSPPTQRMTRSGRYFTWASRFRAVNTLPLPTTRLSTCLQLGLAGAADASASTPTAAKLDWGPSSEHHPWVFSKIDFGFNCSGVETDWVRLWGHPSLLLVRTDRDEKTVEGP